MVDASIVITRRERNVTVSDNTTIENTMKDRILRGV